MTDLLMWVGEQHYPWPHDFSDEVKSVGLSKRVAESAIPLIEPGQTRLAVIHPRAFISFAEGRCIKELEAALAGTPAAFALPIPDDGLTADQVTQALATFEEADRKAYDALVEELGITYHPGIFGYVYLTGLQYVCRPDEEDAPDHLKALGVEGVRMEYDD